MAFVSKNPFTRKLLKEVPAWSKDQTKDAIKKLHEEYLKNRKLGPELCKQKVKKELLGLADSFTKHKAELATMLTTEMGKTIASSEGEIVKTIGHCKFYASKIDEFLATRYIKTDPVAKTGYYIDPLGVAYKIVPFNYPIWIAMKMIAPTILSGNTVLLRPAGSTPQTFEVLEKVFEDAGVKSVRVGYTDHEHTEFIMQQPEMVGVSFTGSTASGARIAEAAAKNIKRCVLELGGNDPFIVFDSADLDLAATLAVRSRLATSGQVCFSSKRFIVEDNVFDKFVAKLSQKVDEFKVGDPFHPDTKMGPLARDDLTEKYLKQLKTTIEKGDNLLHGGKEASGNLVAPSIFKVKNYGSSVLTNEEVFGPTFALIPFKTTDQAVELANRTPYGLGATLVSKDINFAEGVSRLLDSGLTYINNVVGSDSNLPCGGVKHSGFGRDLGQHGVESFANIKTFSIRP